MTTTFPEQHSDTRIFVLSALGSLILHGLVMIGLASMPDSTTVEKKSPTVQVTFLPTPEHTQTPQAPTPPLQPKTFSPKTPPPPMPSTRLHRSQPPVPLVQTSLAPIKPSVLTPPVKRKPILKDTRASQSMKVKSLMKMREPSPSQHSSPSLPTVHTRTHADIPALPPMPMLRKTPNETHSLPAPPMAAASRTITASPPVQTGLTRTRPTIISSSRPIYPRVARESGWEGTVIVRTLIDTNGMPSEVKIRKSCGHPTLDEAAQDAVKSWTFHPAKDGNIPITKWVDIPIKFDLNS